MENITLNLVTIVVLLAINGFFVAAEFALVKAKGFRIETLANEGHSAAKLTLRIQQILKPIWRPASWELQWYHLV